MPSECSWSSYRQLWPIETGKFHRERSRSISVDDHWFLVRWLLVLHRRPPEAKMDKIDQSKGFGHYSINWDRLCRIQICNNWRLTGWLLITILSKKWEPQIYNLKCRNGEIAWSKTTLTRWSRTFMALLIFRRHKWVRICGSTILKRGGLRAGPNIGKLIRGGGWGKVG